MCSILDSGRYCSIGRAEGYCYHFVCMCVLAVNKLLTDFKLYKGKKYKK